MSLATTFHDIALAISSAVDGPFHSATLTWPGEVEYDSGGSIIGVSDPITVPCSAAVDRATEAMRQAEGFNETDVRLIIIGTDTLDAEPTLTMNAGPWSGETFSLRSVERDPLSLTWNCRGRRF